MGVGVKLGVGLWTTNVCVGVGDGGRAVWVGVGESAPVGEGEAEEKSVGRTGSGVGKVGAGFKEQAARTPAKPMNPSLTFFTTP